MSGSEPSGCISGREIDGRVDGRLGTPAVLILRKEAIFEAYLAVSGIVFPIIAEGFVGVTLMETSGALFTTMPVAVPLIVAVALSVAVKLCVPTVFKVAEKACVPASPTVKV